MQVFTRDEVIGFTKLSEVINERFKKTIDSISFYTQLEAEVNKYPLRYVETHLKHRRSTSVINAPKPSITSTKGQLT
jgi:hypothetical protein